MSAGTIYSGIDVSKAFLDVAVRPDEVEWRGSVRAQGTGTITSSHTSRGVADAMPALPVQVHAKKEGQDLPRLQDLLLPDMQA